MEYFRQTVDSTKLYGLFDIPPALRGKKVDVIILPTESHAAEMPAEKSSSAFGCLKRYADPSLIFHEKGAWERAMAEKYTAR